MASSTYRIELFAGAGGTASTDEIVGSAEEVRAFVDRSLAADCVLCVTHLQGRMDYGNFLIFLNAAGLAYVRLLEHRGFHAARPQPNPTGRPVQFLSDGSPFDVDESHAIPAATAIAALHHWLATDTQYPGVSWQDE